MHWWDGSNPTVPKINLDPSKRPQSVLSVFGGALSERDANKASSSENGNHKNGDSADGVAENQVRYN